MPYAKGENHRMSGAGRRAARAGLLLVLVSLAALPLPTGRVAADPWIVANPDGTSDAVWNFTAPADYVRTGTSIAGGTASLELQTAYWNSTTAGDFAGPDSATNVDLARWPGDVALATTSGPSTLLTLQPGAAGEDAYLDRQNGNQNHGADPTMVVDGRNPTQYRPVLRFDLSSIPAGVVIDTATLSLYQSAGIGNAVTANVHYVTAAWDEAQVTWNERLTGTAWAPAGGEYNAYVAGQMTLDNTVGWKAGNVTQLVDLWHRGRITNNGLIVIAPSTGADSDKTFYSSDYAVDPSLRPKLEITYRTLGATGEYVSKVGGPGVPSDWLAVSWDAGDRSLISDEFAGASLDPRWTWTNPPAAYDVGVTTPGSLHVVTQTGVDLANGTFTGHVLADSLVGDFAATIKMSADPTVAGQKAGLMLLLNARNWYAVQKANVAGTVNWEVKRTADAVTTTPVSVGSGNPNPAWLRIERTGNSFTASTSPDGTTWTVRDAYAPGVEYPLHVRIAFFAADGLSGTAHTVDVDYLRVAFGADATVQVQSRIGDTSPVDGTWSGWSAPYGTPSGSTMAGTSRYAEFRLSFGVTYPDHTPDVGAVNLSWRNYPASGVLETADFAPGDVAEWGNFTVIQALNGQTITYAYSTDSGGIWTPVAPPASLQSVSVATGTIRFRATFSTTDRLVTPVLSEMRLTYRHRLDRFYVTASASAAAGVPFTVTVTAKDAANVTVAGWTGAVTLDPRLTDGVTPGGGTLGVTSLAITTGGTATLSTETYTRAEDVRIRASFGSSEGLSGTVSVVPGPLDHILVTPDNVTLLPTDVQSFGAQGYDAWDNPIPGLPYAWAAVGVSGSFDTTLGPVASFTATLPEANGTIEATSGAVAGVATVRVRTGTRPWLAFSTPIPGDHLTGLVTVGYTNSTDVVVARFEYDAGAGWVFIGTDPTIDGAFTWDTSALDFAGGALRAIVENNRTVTNTTVVSPLEVDNSPPTVTLGSVTDDQAGSGTITLTYATSADTARVDLTYFDGTWTPIGSDATVDGTFLWTPGAPINGVIVRAVAVDDVGLQGSDDLVGVGTRTVGANPPRISAVPSLLVRAGLPYDFNLTFYISDPDTPLAALAVSVSDPGNVTAMAGANPSLRIAYVAPGTYDVVLWVSDGTDVAWVLLRIVASGGNPPTVTSPLSAVAFDEDTTALDVFASPLGTHFDDLDGEPLTYAVLGATSIAPRINGDGTVDLWGPAEWSGQEVLRVRAADPGGAFVEAGFLVVVRAVNDAPVLAGVPDLTFDAGATATLDLSAYATDVDNALAQLSVTTDSPYITVNGLVLTLAFPGDWTQAEFTITLSDGAASDSQVVRATIVPPWFRSLYLLAIPPAGILVVVAMFAQRARWRPVKAFLVDERRQLLREFTLDASCTVTYDQVAGAGALDAVEKAVKVEKYHAQTVRGDALAVVLLAYGPVTPDQIEFAREMLVNVQDKFEAALLDRLEDARGYEAELEATAKRLEESRAAFDAQSRASAGMMDAIALAQTKMAAEAASVRSKILDMERREARLKEDRTDLDGLAVELGTLRSKLGEREKRAASESEALRAKAAALDDQESRIVPLTQELTEQQAALKAREADVSAREATVRDKAADLDARLDRIAVREEAAAKDRAALDTERIQLDALKAQLAEEEASADSRSGQLAERDAAVREREEFLQSLETRLGPLEKEMTAKAEALKEQEDRLALRDQEAAARSQQLEARERAALEDRAGIARERADLEEAQGLLDQREKEVDGRIAKAAEAEAHLADRERTIETRESSLDPREAELSLRTAALVERERAAKETHARAEADIARAARLSAEVEGREAAVERDRVELDEAHGRVAATEAALKIREAETMDLEVWLGKRAKDLDGREAILAPRESTVAARETKIASRETEMAAALTSLEAKTQEIEGRSKALSVSEAALSEERSRLDSARAAFLAERADFEARASRQDEEARRRKDDLDAQAKAVGEQQLKLAQERETFEAMRQEKTHWIASRELDLEAREQSVSEKEGTVRGQAEENARRLADIAGREETLEIEQDRLEKARGELDARKADLDRMKESVESKFTQLREEESRKAEEYRTWQATLDSEQALLRQQKEAFEGEVSEIREGWAQRMMRVQQKEEDVAEREAKIREEVEWVARNEMDVRRREKAAEDALQAVLAKEAEAEAARKELAQTEFEIQTRERALREEAVRHTESLTVRARDLQAAEAELTEKGSALEREAASRALAQQSQEAAVAEKLRGLDARAAELNGQDARLAALRQTLADQEGRLARERADMQGMTQQVEARQVEIAHARQRHEEETARQRAEIETIRKSLAQKEAELQSGVERLQRESTTLQDKLGAKAQELAARERSLAAREVELRAEEHDLEARVRDLDSRDRQLRAQADELGAQATALSERQADLDASKARLDETTRRFAEEEATKRKEWDMLQQAFRTQEARLTSDQEARLKDLTARAAQIEGRERTLTGALAQVDLEKARLADASKAQAAKDLEAQAAWARSEKRLEDLKGMEADLLRTRQAFEAERAAWTARRTEEIKQLEATRDAAGEQAQQAERLIEEAQRRLNLAAQAELAAKQKADELVDHGARIEQRRAEAETAERTFETQMSRLQEASRGLAAKEMGLADREKEFAAREASLAAASQETARTSEDLKARQAKLDQEAKGLTTLAADLSGRKADLDTKAAAIEAKSTDLVQRERVLSTELQRAENLMEDLGRKEGEVKSRERSLASLDADLREREETLAARDAELREGMTALERLRKDLEAQLGKATADGHVAESARAEAVALKTDADRAKAQAEDMQKEVAKNMKFLQKKAVDVLDREETLRERESRLADLEKGLEARGEALDMKEKSLAAEREETLEKASRLQADLERLRTKLSAAENAAQPAADMEEWKKEVETRVKIIQKKAFDLLDREEKLRKREEELRAKAQELGLTF